MREIAADSRINLTDLKSQSVSGSIQLIPLNVAQNPVIDDNITTPGAKFFILHV